MNYKKRVQQLFSILLMIALLVTTIPIGVLTANAATITAFAGGTGSAYNPYIIETKEQLNNVRNYPSSCFKLNNDLVFTSEDFSQAGMFYNKGNGFEPIGTYDEPFSGSFDGNNHYIKGLYINIKTSTKKIAAGLFGYSTGTISNLGVADGLIRVETSATMAYVVAGGIVGDSEDGLNRCYNSCNVIATATGPWSVALAGGVVGTTDGIITNCYNAGKVYSESYKSSSGESYAGGIVAKVSGYVSETVIQSCLNVGDVSCDGNTAYFGAIAGYSYQGKAMWCYYKLYSMAPFGNSDAQKSYVHGLTESGMATEQSFDGLTDGWRLTTSFGHPTLSGIEHIKTWNYSEFAGGVGTQDEPYLVGSAEQLDNTRKYLSAHYKLIADIKFTNADFTASGTYYNNGNGWNPIGSTSTDAFTGCFDGNNFSISGLKITINSGEQVSVGLFGYSSGTIKNVVIKNTDYSTTVNGAEGGSFYVGGVVGNQTDGEIVNCSFEGNIETSTTSKYYYPNIGGIVGYAITSNISSCDNKGNISTSAVSSSYCGGICGYSRTDVAINDCYNEGVIVGGLYTGGIVGQAYYTQSITRCINKGEIAGIYYTGGICGYLCYECEISESYNIGIVSSSSPVTANSSLAYSFAGGICGDNARGIILNCYNTGVVESSVVGSYPAYAGGITGKTSGTIQNSYNAGPIKSDDYAAGICGNIDSMNGGSLVNCYFIDVCSQGVYGVADTATKCSKAQMLSFETYIGFDFDSTWGMGTFTTHKLPVLLSNPHIENVNPSDDTTNFAGGDGSIWNPYKIATKEHLNNVRNFSSNGQWFELISDITFADSDFSESGSYCNDGKGWLPIGTDENSPFAGVFDGNNHTINGLKITETSDENYLYVGLFGYCQGTVKNLKLTNVSISGTVNGATSAVYAGGICGYLSTGAITNCSVSGVVLAHETCIEAIDKAAAFAGGIVGKSQNASITSCGNLAKVSAYADSSEPRSGGSWATYARAGGIAGVIKGDISNSYNAGEIIAAVTGNYAYSYAGGIVSSSGNNILNCYNTGSVKSVGNPNNDAGGIVGGYSTGTISDCFNAGNIISEGDAGGATGYLGSGTITNFYNIGNITILKDYHYAGGVVGYYESEEEATIENCYYLNTTPKGIGKGSGSTTICDLLDMKKSITFIGFDFDSVWTFDGNSEYLYPELKNVGTICVHKYDNICDDNCNVCDATREISHPYTWIVDKQNTCGENGSKHEECTICHIKRNEGTEIEASGKHSYVWVTTIEPTCGLNGSRYEKCTICGLSGITEAIPATANHNFEWVIDKAETCGKEGQKHQECIVCHLKQNEGTKILPTGKHSYDNDCDTVCNKCSIERVVNPHTYDNDCDITCNICQKVREVGEHKYDNACDTICNVCQSIREVDPHKYYAVYLADDSIHWLECAICEHKKDVSEHTYSNGCDTTCNICQSLRETEPHKYDDACDESCNICGSIRTITHDYDDATCKAPKTCKVCGATSGTKLSHKSDSGTVTKKATCTATGTKIYKCTLCKATIKTETIAKVAHKYDAGKVTKAATCKATGVKTYTCSVCKGTKTETIAKLTTHTYSNNCDKSCNVCGKTRTVGAHKYSNNCDTTCNSCNAKRTIKHTYSNSCDTTCNVCKAKRTIKHTYSNNCDTSCNICKATRTITHSYKTTTTKATLTKNGSVVKKCSVCGKVASKTAIKYAKTFKLSTTIYTYNGKVKTPSVTVKDSAGKTLKKNTDYTLSYASGRKNVGTYKVTVKMIGKYSGTKTLTFKINPTKTTVSKLTAGKKSITVAITKKSTQVTGYQIQYSTSKTFSKATTKTISSYKTTKYTLKSLSAKKTYYVRVRTYKTVGKTKYYSSWSTYKYIKTK